MGVGAAAVQVVGRGVVAAVAPLALHRRRGTKWAGSRRAAGLFSSDHLSPFILAQPFGQKLLTRGAW